MPAPRPPAPPPRGRRGSRPQGPGRGRDGGGSRGGGRGDRSPPARLSPRAPARSPLQDAKTLRSHHRADHLLGHREHRRLDGDGLVLELYNLVWLMGNKYEGLTIPETVVLEQGFPRVWYCWSQEMGELERRLGKDIVLSQLYERWVRESSAAAAGRQDPRAKEGSIVAQFASSRTRKGGDEEPVLTFDYFDTEGLERFVNVTAHSATGVLQRFTPPKLAQNVVLQCMWSPHASLCTARRNIYTLEDPYVPPADRGCTFDGPPSLSVMQPVSPFVKGKVVREVATLVRRIEDHLRARVTGMVGFFKFDDRGQLFMLQCTSVRTLRVGDDVAIGPAPPPLRLGVPFDNTKRAGKGDIIAVRFPASAAVAAGVADSYPVIDLGSLTDKALNVLRVEDPDIITARGPRRKRAGAAKGAGSGGGAALVIDAPKERARPRVSGIGLPPAARDHPEEFALAEDYFLDVLYRARWHFHREESESAPDHFQHGFRSRASRERPQPFDFGVPSDIIAIVGFEGVDDFCNLFGAFQVPGEQLEAKPRDWDAPPSQDDDNDGDGGRGSSALITLRIESLGPTCAQLALVRDFVHERLVRGMPKFQRGVDWEGVRNNRRGRRSTSWFGIVGASRHALKLRADAKRQAGLVSVAELLSAQNTAAKLTGKGKGNESPSVVSPSPNQQAVLRALRAKNQMMREMEEAGLSPSERQRRAQAAAQVLQSLEAGGDDFLKNRRASSGGSSHGVDSEDGDVAERRLTAAQAGDGSPRRRPLYAPPTPVHTGYLRRHGGSPRRPRPGGPRWRIAAAFAPPPRPPPLGTPYHSPRRGGGAEEYAAAGGWWPAREGRWRAEGREERPRSAAAAHKKKKRPGRIPSPQLDFWLQ